MNFRGYNTTYLVEREANPHYYIRIKKASEITETLLELKEKLYDTNKNAFDYFNTTIGNILDISFAFLFCTYKCYTMSAINGYFGFTITLESSFKSILNLFVKKPVKDEIRQKEIVDMVEKCIIHFKGIK